MVKDIAAAAGVDDCCGLLPKPDGATDAVKRSSDLQQPPASSSMYFLPLTVVMLGDGYLRLFSVTAGRGIVTSAVTTSRLSKDDRPEEYVLL